MPHRPFDWHEHVKEVEGEYQAARCAIDHLKTGVLANPVLLKRSDQARISLHHTDTNLEGTYIVRLFAAFEAALRSYDRARHNDLARQVHAAVLIDTIGGRRGQGISVAVRAGAHAVRHVRNFWAHEDDATLEPMTIAEARARLQTFLSWLPEEWG